ncbi:type IV secretion protein Rhs [Actinomadura sp. WMMB 499]|nr:type IV secretion protein Rhs [Actinomadura sp. WMMB 499]
MLFGQVDVALPGALPLVLERTHLSGYRDGGLFGRSWASTLDQRLELDARGVHFLSADGMILEYPQSLVPNVSFLPSEGPRLPLTLAPDGSYVLHDPRLDRTLHFPAPGETHGWSRLPLVAIGDRRGNRVELGYADGVLREIRHSAGYRIFVDTEDRADGETDGETDGGPRIVGLRTILEGTADATGAPADDAGDAITLVRYEYDAAGLLSGVVNSSGRAFRFDYDGDGRLTAWHDRNGHWYRYEYDEDGRAVRAAGPDGRLGVSLRFRPEERTTVVTDSLGNATTYRYNEHLQIIAETDPLGATTRSEWDARDRLLSRTDPLGGVVRFSYDEHGDLVRVRRPDGETIETVHDEARRPVAVTEPGGRTWRREYDERGNVTSLTDPSGATTRARYDERGNLSGLVDTLGHVTRVVSNAAGLPLRVTDPAGAETRYEYDSLGRLTALTDPAGGVTRYGWTAEHRMAWRRSPAGAVDRWTYDAEGNAVEFAGATGELTRAEYGPFDVLVTEIGPDGARTESSHDTELRITAVTNPRGEVWRYEYDAAGGVVAETDFNGRTLRYALDALGRIEARTNALGQTTSFVRDALGNVVEEHSPEGVATFAYGADGFLARAVNANADLRFERDAMGRVTAEICNGRVVASAYDAAGRRVHRRTPSGAESAWSFDSCGRPAALSTAGESVLFHYDAAGREIQRNIGAATVLSQQWDAADRLVAQSIWGTRSTVAAPRRDAPEPALLQHRTYAYDPDGNVTAIGDRLGADRRFELDRRGRVRTVHAADRREEREEYVYDALGDLVEARFRVPAPADGPAPSLAGDAAGSREYDGTLLRRAGSVHYEHDAQGRVTVRSHVRADGGARTWRHHWDSDDRLVGVDAPDGRHWRYRYDALGRRISKQRTDGDGTGVFEQFDFVWDGHVLAEQVQRTWSAELRAFVGRGLVWEHDPRSLRPLTQTERLPSRDVPQEWIDREFQAIVTDLVGTPVELVDTAGSVRRHMRTTLWGVDLSGTGSNCPLRFPGQYFDAESDLNYNYHRYYNAADGRYQSADPLGLAGALNPHAYVPNPLDWLDPLGLKGSPGQGEEKVKLYHYTDKAGYNGIRSGDPYHVREGSSKNGAGPFWTTKSPADLTEPNAFKKLGITSGKSEYVLEAEIPKSALRPLPGGRGDHVLMTPGGIKVPRSDAHYIGPTRDWEPS